MQAKLERSSDEVVLTSPAGIAWFREALYGEQIEIIRRKGRSWAVTSEQVGQGWSRFTLFEIRFVNPQPKIEATPMNDQMQYIVIEGRKPQDGAKPARALLILPKWISPTLACAGIVGRVIELTDGNIIEQGAVYMGEQETLESLRIDIEQDSESQMETDDRHEQELQAEGVAAPVLSNEDPHIADAAYRQGMEAQRNAILGDMSRAGMPPNTRPMDWVQGLVAELAELKNPPAPVDEFHYSQQWELLNSLTGQFGCLVGSARLEWLRVELEELAQFRKDRPETLAKLQAAEDNLDAWRNAAGRNPMIVQNTDSQTGRIVSLGVDKGANGDVVALNRQVAELQTQLQEFEGVDEQFQQLNDRINQRDHRIEQLRKDLKKIRKLVKAAL